MTDDRIDERLEELLSAEALGGLDADDARELDRLLARHGVRPDVTRMRSEYADVAARLAFALPPSELPEGFEDRVVAAALAQRPASPATDPTGSATAAVRLRERRAAKTGGGWKAIVAVAASVVLFVGGWLVSDLTRSEPEVLSLASARVVPFDAGSGDLAVAYEPGRRGAYLIGSGLPTSGEIGSDKVLEVWTFEDGEAVPQLCLTPPADGSLFEYADVELDAAEAMAVTVEPASCPSQPTSDPVAVASLA